MIFALALPRAAWRQPAVLLMLGLAWTCAGFGIDPKVLQTIANEVAAAAAEGVEVAVVVGGGNFFRGVDRWDGLDRASADYVG